MAELIVTPEEERASSYLDWSDESLGRLVKMIGLLINDEYGKEAAWISMAAHLLVDFARKTNSTSAKVNVTGCTKNGEDIGDWVVHIKKLPR